MSPWVASLAWWLADFYVLATVLLAAGLVGMLWIRQPVHRVTAAWALTLALVALGAAAAVPAWPRVHVAPTPPVRATSGQAEQPSLVSVPDPLASRPQPIPAHYDRRRAEVESAAPVSEVSIVPNADSPVLGQERSAPRIWPAMLGWLTGVFVAGSAPMGLWLAFGVVEAAWLCRNASTAPAALQGQLRAIVGEGRRMPWLLVSPSVGNAVALGILRPTILLPARLAGQSDPGGLRAVLAHEWAHIRNRDLWLLGLVRVLLIVLFPHPLYWWLRRTIRSSQESVADAVAADGRGGDYAARLLEWMRQIAGHERVRAAAAVGIWERPSELSRRIAMLVDETFQVRTHAMPRWRFGVLGLIGLLTAGLSLVTLRPLPPASAAPTSEEKAQPAAPMASVEKQAPPQAPAAKTPEGLSYTGGVIDKLTRRPIQGATVRVRRRIASSTEDRLLEESKHETDAQGKFRFRITTEQAGHRSAYLDFDVTHPGYSRFYEGYSLGMIRKNEKLGERPFFESLQLQPAEQVTGTLVKPDGTPAEGVKVLAYSKAKKDDWSDHGSWTKGRTDAHGEFQLNLAKGEAGILWILPKDFVFSTHLLHEKRGDLGRFVLEEGIRVSGRVLDSQGKPVGDVWVNADFRSGPAKRHIDLPVADAAVRSALTGPNGEFAMDPLPAGEYSMILSERPRDQLTEDHTRRPLRDVFVHQSVTFEQGKAAQSLEIRAVPHVVVEIQQLDSAGKPRKGQVVDLTGQSGPAAWWSDHQPPDPNGKIVIKAPKGLTEARLRIIKNEHQASRFRWPGDKKLFNDDPIRLGTLKDDIKGLEVIYYTAPSVVVRAVAEDPSPIQGFKCQAIYANDKRPDRDPGGWVSGGQGDVRFEKQTDGRWRSIMLLPDESFLLVVEAEGYRPWAERFSLAEGAVKEVEARLQER